MRLALAQINPLIGDFSGNLAKITQSIEQACQRHCDLVIFPELALLGYPPRDLLDNAGFVRDSLRYWPPLRDASRRIGIICGAVTENESQRGKPYHNSALLFCNGELQAKVHKQLLPSYDVFDEERYFEPGATSGWVDFAGQRLGITICEDIWNVSDFLPHFPYGRNPVLDLAQASAEVLINISASPYHARKIPHVNELLKSHAEKFRMQVVYVNQVGGNDELIFQGHSMAWDATGKPAACAADFREDLITYDTRAQIGDGQSAGLDPAAEMIDLGGVKEPACFFEGTAREAASRFPKSSNITAMLALATAGLDKTKVKLVADPTRMEMHTVIEFRSGVGNLRVEWNGVPSETNPKTSADVPFTVIKALRNLTGTVCYGL